MPTFLQPSTLQPSLLGLTPGAMFPNRAVSRSESLSSPLQISPQSLPLAAPTRDSVHFRGRRSLSPAASPELNLHTKDQPFDATVVRVETLKPENGKTPPEEADVFSVVLDLTGSNFVTPDGKRARIFPGHSLLILPDIPRHLDYLQAFRKVPYEDAEKLTLREDSHRQYLLEHRYSIADVWEGDQGVRVRLVVRRVEYEQDGQKKLGLVSNQLAGMRPGDRVTLFGPNTNRFLMPPEQDANMLLFCTGIASMAPFKDFLQTRFDNASQTPGKTSGETCLYSGYRHRSDELCPDLYRNYMSDVANRFTYRTAFSRDSDDPQRLDQLVLKDADRIFGLLDERNTYVYFCGVRGVEAVVISALLRATLQQDRSVDDVLDRIQAMKQEGRWRVEGSVQPFRYTRSRI